MTRIQFSEWAIGKSKREIMAVIPQDTTIGVFTTRKGKISMMSVIGGEWKLYLHLHFDKATQRVIETT